MCTSDELPYTYHNVFISFQIAIYNSSYLIAKRMENESMASYVKNVNNYLVSINEGNIALFLHSFACQFGATTLSTH